MAIPTVIDNMELLFHVHVSHTSIGAFTLMKPTIKYLVVVPESQGKLVGVVGLELLEDHLRREGLEQSLVNVQ